MRSFLLVLLVSAFCSLKAQRAGSLDSSFGNEGMLITNISAVVTSSKIQDDGKIIVCASPGSLLMLRYLPNGDIDKTFGNNGKVVLQSDNKIHFSAGDFAIRPDHKIVVVGDGENRQGTSNFLLARFTENGVIDSSFGTNGIVERDDNKGFNRYDHAYAVALQADGGIIVAGTRQIGYERSFLLKRYFEDGRLDIKFGNKGSVVTTFYGNDEVKGVVVQPDGRIVAGGRAGTINIDQQFGLVRYLTDGSLDKTFGVNGKVITDFGANAEYLNDIAIQDDGMILAAGMNNIGIFSKYQYMAVARYNTDGILDNTFGKEGKTSIVFSGLSAEATAIQIQSNKKIVLTGRDFDLNQQSDFACARITDDGIVDSSFGTNGTIKNDLGAQDYCTSSVLQQDGKIMLIGNRFTDLQNNIALVRYYGDPIKQQSPIVKKIKRWLRNHTLNWQYNADVDYFVIEQSSNGVNGFKEIAKVKAYEQRTMINEQWVYTYNLNDFANSQQLKANSKTYYRITAVSKNSKVVSTIISDEDVISITISPNPVKDVMKISGLLSAQKSTINIINRNGNVLQTTISNSSTYNMNISQLKSGLYNVQITTGNKTQTIQFIKE